MREKRFIRNMKIHKRGKYYNSSRSSSSDSSDGDDNTTQRHNGDNKYEYATEKRLKWVSSKCTHYCTDLCICRCVSLCVALCATSSSPTIATAPFGFFELWWLFLLTQRQHTHVFVWRSADVLVSLRFTYAYYYPSMLPLESLATCSIHST